MSPAEGAAGYVALTFDDGPYPETTAALLAILRERGAVGTFFVTGEHCAEHPDLLRALADAGMPVANHTWDHPSLPGLAPEEQQAQLSRTQDVVRSVLGEAPALFRPPFGDTDAAVRALAAAQGMREVWADVDARDWDGAPASAVRAAAARLEAGQVILLHDWPTATVEALPGILDDLAARRLRTGVVDPATGDVVGPDRID